MNFNLQDEGSKKSYGGAYYEETKMKTTGLNWSQNWINRPVPKEDPISTEEREEIEGMIEKGDTQGLYNKFTKRGYYNGIMVFIEGEGADKVAILDFCDYIESERAAIWMGKGTIKGCRFTVGAAAPTPESTAADKAALEVAVAERIQPFAGATEYYEDASTTTFSSPGLLHSIKELAGSSSTVIAPAALFYVLIGKEFFVFNEDIFSALLAIPALFVVGTVLRAKMTEGYEKYIADLLVTLHKERNDRIEGHTYCIAAMQANKDWYAVAPEIFAAQQANIDMGREIIYRQNLKEVEVEVKKRLDYQVDLEKLHEKIEYNHIKKWVENAVQSSITPKQEEEALQKCIADIEHLALARHA